MAGSEYQKRQDGNQWVVFDVTPAPSPKFLYLTIMGAISILFGLRIGPLGWFVLVPVGIFGVWMGYFRDIRPPAHRSASSFKVSPTGIESNGRTFTRDDIHRLIIKNGINNEVISGVMAPVGAPMLRGMAHRARVSGVANALELETGGKAYVLAGGMDPTTAFGLLHDVSKVIGLNVTA